MRVLARLASVTCVLSGAALAPGALADDATKSSDVGSLEGLLNETIVTTASKSAELGSTAPGVSAILTSEDIRRYGLHTVAEAIDFLAVGMVTSDPLRTVEVGARGIAVPGDQGDHVLLLVNGHAVNEALYGAARFDRGAGIPIELVDHIEVIVGPGSVLYGSNAMFGVINVVTKNAQAFPGTHVVAETEVGKSWRGAAGGGYNLDLFGSRAEVIVAVEYYRQQGPSYDVPRFAAAEDPITFQPFRFGRNGPYGTWGGTLDNSVYSEVPSGHLTLRWKDFEANFHASLFKHGAPSYPEAVEPVVDFDDADSYELDRSLWVDLKQRARVSDVIELTFRLYGDTFEHYRYADVSRRYFCQFAGTETCRRETLGLSRWGGAEVQSTFDWNRDGSLTTLLGADGRIRYAGSQADVTDFDTGAHLESTHGVLEQTDSLLGTYLQQTWQPSDRFGLNAGARLDVYSDFGSHVSPRAAASTRLWRGGVVKLLYAEAFRAPSWYEARSSSRAQLPAQDLNAETVRSVELVLDQKLGTHRLTWGVFRSWWSDMVQIQGLTPAEVDAAVRRGELPFEQRTAGRFENVSAIDSWGFNAGYDGTVLHGKLVYALNVTAAQARTREPGAPDRPVTVAPRVFGNARVSYAVGGPWPTLAVAGHYLARRPIDGAYDSKWSETPMAPAQLVLRGTVSGPFPGVPGLSYRASLDYSTASGSAYPFGILQNGYDALYGNRLSKPILTPVDTLRGMVGLEIDF